MPDEVILGALGKRLVPPSSLPERERQRRITDTLDRWEKAFWGRVELRNGPARQAEALAYRRLVKAGDRLQAAHEAAGIPLAPKVGESIKVQRVVSNRSPTAALDWINAEIDYLLEYEQTIRASQTANIIRVPRGGYPAADDDVLRELHRRLAELRALADEVEAKRRKRRGELLEELLG